LLPDLEYNYIVILRQGGSALKKNNIVIPYDVRQWPDSVYPNEVIAECPEALQVIDTLILNFRRHGPSPDGYGVKTLGKQLAGLWQVNLKVQKRQVRVLYSSYGQQIVLFRIHKKGSTQEQQRAYELAVRRKRQFEAEKEKIE
jgi:hypothetical protein